MTKVDQTLKDGVTVVTGASSGLGRALACELAGRGHHVVGFARSHDGLNQTARHAGDRFFPLVVDVADVGAVRNALQLVADTHGPITRLINNAAIYPRADFIDQTPEDFAHTLQINLGGIVNCTHSVLQHMLQTGAGRIVNVASFADIAPLPASSAYSVSKGAARILTRALVADLGDRFPDIVISDWLPGMLATDMGIPDGLNPAVAAKWGATLLEWHDPTLNGAVFERDTEVLPHRSLKRRLKDKVLGRAPTPRRL